MALTNQQFDEIMRDYNARQLANGREQDRRREEIYSRLPEYMDLDEMMSSYARSVISTGLSGGAVDMQANRNYLKELSEKKTAILTEAGFPADYLAPIYTCAACKDTGFIEGKKCECFKRAEVQLVYKQSNIAPVLSDENFDHFDINVFEDSDAREPGTLSAKELAQKAFDSAKDFVKYFDEKFDNILYLGNTGCGKTFLSNCIAKELLDTGHSVIYLSASEFFKLCEEATFHHDEEAAAYHRELLDCQLLIIDDLGTEVSNSYTTSKFFECINERMVQRRPTIISTNLSLQQLANTYSERTASRILSSYQIIKLKSKDIRMKKFT